MDKKLLLVTFIICFLFAVVVLPQISYCQTATPTSTIEPTPTAVAQQGITSNLLFIAIIIAVVVVVVGVTSVFVVKRRVSEKSLRKVSSSGFEAYVLKKFNGKPSDPDSGITGFTEGGQPLLIKQTDYVSLAEVEDFVKLLAKGKAQKGTIVAFNFDKDTIEGKVTAMDNGIDLEMLRITELVNKRFSNKIKKLASSPVTFEATTTYPTTPTAHPTTYTSENSMTKTQNLEKTPNIPQNEGLRPRVFISNSNTKVADQVKRMLDFLHYDYVIGGKEETTVPIPENKFELMRDSDCAIINICAAEQERRYSGLYVLNSNVISEINAAYLKYNMQVILLVERKVDLPPNFKGLQRIEYDSDDLSFNAAMDLEKILAGFKKL